MNINFPISHLNKVGKAVSSRLRLLGIYTISDLIYYFPFRYEDYSKLQKLGDVKIGMTVTLQGKITNLSGRKGFRSVRYITEAIISDGHDAFNLVWFNQPYLLNALHEGETISVSGKVQLFNSNLTIVNPVYEKSSFSGVHTGIIAPFYSLTANITQKQIRFLIYQSLKYVSEISDWIPNEIQKKYDLIDLSRALSDIHFPKNDDFLNKAQKRLKFDELFLLQLQNQLLRRDLEKLRSIKQHLFIEDLKSFVDSLGFDLTDAQRKTSWQILKDLELLRPMNRLLQGDVGSGKTIVAGLGILNTIQNKYQAGIMAPTEILAQQHFNTFVDLYNDLNVKIALLTGSCCELNTSELDVIKTKSKKREFVLSAISDGSVDLVIGTHALLEKKVVFSKLGFVVVDEQHRFGVMQRKKLKEKMSDSLVFPNMLSMTATPIPRSLALTLYGDLDISVIDEMPKGRKEIKTALVKERERNSVYNFVFEEIKKQKQCYVICPLIEESDALGVVSVKEMYESLNTSVFKDFSIGLLHGKLKPIEKEKIMSDFKSNKIQILVSTSVIEVGVDVPNATIMMIEGADRFGLAQLHQFRGRVGRGEDQSYCFLFAKNVSKQSFHRLNMLTKSNDGFFLASKDLEIRGPGEVFGHNQSGFPEFRLATMQDQVLISYAQEASKIVIENNLLDSNELLREKIQSKLEAVHLE